MRALAFDFAREVDRQIEGLTREDFYHRTGPAKRLLEELYPLSRLALTLKYPGAELEVEAFEDYGSLDGVLRWTGNRSFELRIEVTYVHSYEEALRRELLLTTGSTPGAGQIYRDRASRKIIATGAIESNEEEADRLGATIVELFRKKCVKKYPRGTMLLIAFDDPTFFGFDCWHQLLSSIKRHGGLVGAFGEVHLFNCGSNELQRDVGGLA
jgi:hypothetical protein